MTKAKLEQQAKLRYRVKNGLHSPHRFFNWFFNYDAADCYHTFERAEISEWNFQGDKTPYRCTSCLTVTTLP